MIAKGATAVPEVVNDEAERTAEPRTEEAMEFLQAFSPEGPWALTAISTDRKGIDTATFGPAELDDCRAWIDKYNGERNLYFPCQPGHRI